MAIYLYKAVAQGCQYCQAGFEVMQMMRDVPLQLCPKCNQPVKKCVTNFNGGIPMLSKGNLRDKGFTRLENKGGGTFEKS